MGSREITSTTERGIDAETDQNCPECAGVLLTESGEVACGDCGLVVVEAVLDTRGTGLFSGGRRMEEPSNAPLTPARHDRGLSTEIGFWRDGNGNTLDGRTRRRLGRLRTHHRRARFDSKAERNIAHGFREIDRIRSGLDLPRSVRDRACTLYRAAQSADLIVGRSIEMIAAGSVYAACREGGLLRTAEEVAKGSVVSTSNVWDAYQVLLNELGLTVLPRGPRDFLARFAAAIDASDRQRTRADELLLVATEAGLHNGRNPAGVAAACLYVAAQEIGLSVTQRTLAEIADVTPVTIRSRVQELREVGGTKPALDQR